LESDSWLISLLQGITEMNDRIGKLAEQAGLLGPSSRVGNSHEAAEKFAELIVRECMACSTWVGKVNKYAIEPEHTAHTINQRIKEHFGVKE
jgi:hypothetical protein